MKTVRGTNQYMRKLEFLSDKAWRDIGWLVAFILLVIILGYWYQQHRFVSPCPDSGCLIKIVQANDLPIDSHEALILKSRHPRQIREIWKKESSFGLNSNPSALHNLCKAKGMSNEFGFGGMQLKLCFKTFQDALERVDKWLDDRDAESLCYYNTGVKIEGKRLRSKENTWLYKSVHENALPGPTV